MKYLLICLCFIFVISCKTDTSDTQIALASMDTQAPKLGVAMYPIISPFVTTEPYELKLNMQKLDNDTYELEILMELNNGAHFVSPNSKGNFTGVFTVFIDDNDKIEPISKLLETPPSVEEYDSHPYVNGYVNWVRENTTYKQKIKRISDEDFRVLGHIQFTIEPRCTFENIPFIIKYKNGELKFEKDQC